MTPGNKRNIALWGFMGTGKSTAGRLVAARLGLAFVDTDAVIEARAGRTIADIFAQEGEPAFRALEAAVCQEVAAGREQVIAAGGGALLDPAVFDALAASSLLVNLTCDLDEILRRVGDDPARPLFAGERARLARLLADRAAHYARVSHQIDTTHLAPHDVAEEIIRLWQS